VRIHPDKSSGTDRGARFEFRWEDQFDLALDSETARELSTKLTE
jgi:thiamine biosynthesis protein ThiC